MKTTLFTCAFMFFASVLVAQISEKEKQVLIDFYNTTNGPEWVDGWDLEQPVNQWNGVTVENNSVTSIRLLFNNVNGTLPSSLGELENLKVLELSFNPISGAIPAELGNLKNLEILAINGASLTGEIPEELGNLSNLKQLHLSSNQLSGSVPQNVTNLKKIEVFNIFENRLSGNLPAGLAKCRNLKELIVAENNFTNHENFSVVLLSKSGSSMNFLDLSAQNDFGRSVIALETEDSDD
ncbi:leucine-rich repeat domain-containing protein [Aequorivita echinoideorum]|nr:Two component regulator three Y domain protein [Aequorivita echinoideorum]